MDDQEFNMELSHILIVDDDSRLLSLLAVSYTHLTLPTNREV